MFEYTDLSSSTDAAVWKVPPVASAIACSVVLSAGTGCGPYPGRSTVPWSVPNAMVDTGTPACLAAVAADSGERPLLEAPSLSSTIRAGGGLSSLAVVWALNVLIASRHVKIASPIAVESCGASPSMPRLTASRSIVGGTTTEALPPNFTSPTLMRGGSMSTNDLAPARAASMRLGNTSVAFIDSDTSIAIITVARSRGTFTAAVGCAAPIVSTVSPIISSANVKCRRQPGRRGATEANSSTLLKRATYFLR